MNAILGYTTLLQNYVESEKGQNYLRSVQKAGNTLVDLINDILDLSKIEVGKVDLHKDNVDLRFLLADIRDIFSLKIYEKKLAFKLQIDPELPEALMMDELRTRQILFNLVGNAIKFTDQGAITLSATASSSPGSPDLIDLTLIVQDTGIGIAESQLQSIFEPFRQQDGQSSKKYGGTGLGLAITKRLIEMMGGQIQLVSEPGAGSTFTVLIPKLAVGWNKVQPGGSELPVGSVAPVEARKELQSAGAGQPTIVSTSEIPNLPNTSNLDLVAQLEGQLSSQWLVCTRSNRVSDTREFAKTLQSLGTNHGAPVLSAYAADLQSAVESFHSQKIQELLQQFPKVLEQLKAAK